VPSIAGPKRPQDRINLSDAKSAFRALPDYVSNDETEAETTSLVDEASEESFPASDSPGYLADGLREDRGGEPAHSAANGANGRPSKPVKITSPDRGEFELDHGAVVIASITSCTNTSNPSVMLGAALLARNAVEKGLSTKPWVKTSMAPGSQVVTDYYEQGRPVAVPGEARLPPGRLRLHHLHRQLGSAARGDLQGRGAGARPVGRVGAVRQPQLRGPHQPRRQDELPGLAAAGDRLRAGRHDGLRLREPAAGPGPEGNDVYLRDIWPSPQEIQETIDTAITRRCSPRTTPRVRRRRALAVAAHARGRDLRVGPESTYVRKPPYFEGMTWSRSRSPTSTAPGCWPSSATR
jgi:aconitate hydratase